MKNGKLLMMMTALAVVFASCKGDEVKPQKPPVISGTALPYPPVPVVEYTGPSFYVDSENGNDNNAGTSEATAWKTLTKVNSVPFAAGSVVRFKRGGFWRGQLVCKNGTSGNAVVYTTYGSGAKPIIQGSLDRSQASQWTETAPGSGLWRTDIGPAEGIGVSPNPGVSPDIGNIIFDHGAAFGIKKRYLEEVSGALHFYCDWPQSADLYLKCDRNPATKYASVEMAVNRHIVSLNNGYGGSHITVDGLAVRYGAAHGIYGMNVTGIVIRNCDISWIGGGYQNIPETIRWGNGIEFWCGCTNSLIENNRIWEIYDTATTNQGNAGASYGVSSVMENVTWKNNLIWSAESAFEYWNSDPTARTTNVVWENNTALYCSNCFGHNQRPNGPFGNHLFIFGNTLNSDVIIRRNVFYYSTDAAVRIQTDWRTGFVIDYNLYYTTGTMVKLYVESPYVNYVSNRFDEYQARTGLDAHSLFANPVFADLEGGDYRLSLSSPEAAKAWGKQQW